MSVFGLAFAVLLAGCSGGGGGSTTASSTTVVAAAEGQYNGTTDTNRTFSTIVLDDGTFYAIYTAAGFPNVPAGFIEGQGASNNGSFTATNARDYNFEANKLTISNLSASYRAKESIAGSVTPASGGASVTFSGTYDSVYEQAPLLATLAGTYTSILGTAVTIGSDGAVSGADGDCMFSGTVSPRSKGNVYNTSISYGANCDVVSGQTLTGVAVLDAAGKRLTSVVRSSDKNIAAMFIGVKP